jgi:alginate O-acetyltransferase complex protein AlgI
LQWDSSQVVDGVTRIIHGLIKKLVIANLFLAYLLGDLSSGAQVLERLADLPTWKVWGFCVLSFLYLYMDFSAYSDIAIGTSRLFGLRIMENFNWPILASNIGSYWQRWHMTLAKWCQGYVYLPVIGLTRNPYLATYMSFTVMGLWHSASAGWIGWGLYHATGVSVYGYWLRYRRKRRWRGLDAPGRRWIAHIMTMAFVSGGPVFTSLHGVGGPYDILRVFAKLFFLELPVWA